MLVEPWDEVFTEKDAIAEFAEFEYKYAKFTDDGEYINESEESDVVDPYAGPELSN